MTDLQDAIAEFDALATSSDLLYLKGLDLIVDAARKYNNLIPVTDDNIQDLLERGDIPIWTIDSRGTK